MHAFGVVLRGELEESGWVCFLNAVTEAIGMSAAGEPAVWTYPMEGKGGVGRTFVLPITESFLALDTWPDHDGAYLFVNSCRAFDIKTIEKTAHCFSLVVMRDEGQRFYSELNLK